MKNVSRNPVGNDVSMESTFMYYYAVASLMPSH